MKKLVAKLHGKVEDSADRLIHCTHVVVFDRPLKRTIKLCVGVSLPDASMVTDGWFSACESANAFVPTAPFLLSGEQASQPGGTGKPWRFNASESRKRASSDRLLEVSSVEATIDLTGSLTHSLSFPVCLCLSMSPPHTSYSHGDWLPPFPSLPQGCHFYITEKTKPKPSDLRSILEAAGGSVLNKPPSAKSARPVVVVTTDEERANWAALARLKDVNVVRADHLLCCVLQQTLDLGEQHLLR